MIGDLRAFLEGPLESGVAHALVALAVAVSVGFAIVLTLASIGGGRPSPASGGRDPRGLSSAPPSTPGEVARPTPRSGHPRSGLPRQDPQDRAGTEAHSRAARTVRGHRALQRVPYRGRGIVVTLVGADQGRAVLSVRAATVRAAKRGWRRFLRGAHDSGRRYEPRYGLLGRGGRR